jgi:hypothetical protein
MKLLMQDLWSLGIDLNIKLLKYETRVNHSTK